jgi:NAD dependent epimerase/dehydratase family
LADERIRFSESGAIGAYKQSKVAAERVVETMIGQNRLPAIIVHPTAPIGPRDQKPTPPGRVIIEAVSGRIPGFALSGLHERVQQFFLSNRGSLIGSRCATSVEAIWEPRVRPLAHQAHKPASLRTAGRLRQSGLAAQR